MAGAFTCLDVQIIQKLHPPSFPGLPWLNACSILIINATTHGKARSQRVRGTHECRRFRESTFHLCDGRVSPRSWKLLLNDGLLTDVLGR